MTADIKPVAWVSNRDPMFGDGWGATSPIVYSDPGAHAAPSGELVPLYLQSAIDSLRAEVEAWRELSDHVRAGACNAIWPDRYTDARTRDVAAALKRAERLAEALRWYANPEVYKPHPHGPAFDDRDLSFKARAALRDHDQEVKGG